MLAVADAGPLHYLVLTGTIGLLPRFFPTVLVPQVVCDELRHARAPSAVRDWIAAPPAWLRIIPTPDPEALPFPRLDIGERAAIALALAEKAEILLIDDRRGVAIAQAHGLTSIGTLGLLDQAATRGMIDFAAVAAQLRATNFRYPSDLVDALIARHRKGPGP